MAQRGECSKGRTLHPMVNIGRAEGRATVALHGMGVGGQHADAKAMGEASVDFSALEFESLGEGECVQPCRGRAARAAEQAGACALLFCRAGVVRLPQGVSAGLCCLPREVALCCSNSSQAARAHLLVLWRPQSASTAMQGSRLGPELCAVGSVEWPKGLWPIKHGLVGGCSGGKVLPSAGLVRDRQRAPWRGGRVICAVTSPSTLGRPKMARALSTALLSALCTAASTCIHWQPGGR
jgi:hypothetical protein